MANINTTAYSSPNRGGPLKEYKYIVLHHTGAPGNGEGSAGYLCRVGVNASANFVVCKNGTIYQLIPAGYVSWHAGRGSGFGVPNDMMNNYSIGIEIANLGDGVDPYPEAQLNALDELIAWFDIQWGAKPIIDHKMWAPGRKPDMSANFPLANYIKYRRHTVPAPATPIPAPIPPARLFLAHMTAAKANHLASLAYQAGFAAWIEGVGEKYSGALGYVDALRYIGEHAAPAAKMFPRTPLQTFQGYAVIAIHGNEDWVRNVAVQFALRENAAHVVYNVNKIAKNNVDMTSALESLLIKGENTSTLFV